MKKSRWYSMLLIGLALLLGNSIVACSPAPISAPPAESPPAAESPSGSPQEAPAPEGTPSTEPSPEPEPAGTGNVQITRIFYDGLVPRSESDEYVEITNLGNEPQDLSGWVLKDIDEGYPSLTFPSYILAPGANIRVHTNEIHPEWGGFSFGYGKAVWNNKDPDMAALYNAQGQEVSRKSY